MTVDEALGELLEGNARFVSGVAAHPNQDAEHRAALAEAQAPFAVIFGCSDSRLAAEIIFDRGLGDLFVVRTAGHAVGRGVLGSIEYAVSVLAVPLVVVLGHSSCGAVTATRDSVTSHERPEGHLGHVIDAIAPSVREAAARGVSAVDRIVDIHVERTAEHVRLHCPPLNAAVAAGRSAIVGMSYRLTDGRVRVVSSTLHRPPGRRAD